MEGVHLHGLGSGVGLARTASSGWQGLGCSLEPGLSQTCRLVESANMSFFKARLCNLNFC